jgi:hypothetical protein|tara:strand:- start:69 stop:338 length:270 start_codon:yes stop_codon:yes gene_type:complete
MDLLKVLEQYGTPIAVAVAFGFFIWKQNKYIQDDLSKDLHQKFNRLEGILIKLIDNSKRSEIGQKGLERSYKSLVDIITTLFSKNNKKE